LGKYFGTDGVRGVANQDLTPDFAFRLGRCVGARLAAGSSALARPFVVIGRDTRRSGPMLEAALTAGLCSVGVDVWLLGVLPTPAVAWIARRERASAGIMISASHNPAPDNGIKIFSSAGFKLPDDEEDAIEALIDAPEDRLPRPTGTLLGQAELRPDLVDAYEEAVCALIPEGLGGMRVALDCAHGAAYAVAPRVLRALGAQISVLGAEPDGDNINAGVGSTHMGALIEEVGQSGSELGIAFDGDADRCLAVDGRGNAVDGDKIMWLCLRHLRAAGRLASADVVSTVMSNMGFEEAIAQEGGQVFRTRVGDRYVLEEMRRRDIRIGGEQSGHVIFLDDNTTGDGLITALRLLAAVRKAGKPLHDLAAGMPVYPQLLRNVRVQSVAGWQDDAEIASAIRTAEERLKGVGRLVVRASGTEPLIRVMAEAKDAAMVEEVVSGLIATITRALTGADKAAAAH